MKSFSLKSFFRPKQKPTLGIDIGSHTIKLIEFEGSGDKRCLKTVGRTLLPKGAVVDGSLKEREIVEECLKNLISNCAPKLKRVSASISGYSVIVKRINVPYLTEREIEENLIIESEKYVPFEIEEVYIDFSILKMDEERGESDIFLVAAKKEIVDEYADLLESIGLIPSIIDVDAFCLANAFEMAYGRSDEAAVLIDIGATKTNLNIVKSGMPVFTRDMAFGGEHLTEAIEEATGLNNLEAEKVKIIGTKDDLLKKEVSETIVRIVDLWVEEVGKAINFYKASSPNDGQPTCIFLSGGTSLLSGIETIFTKKLGLETKKFNCLSELIIPKEIDKKYVQRIEPQMAIASGLALRSVE